MHENYVPHMTLGLCLSIAEVVGHCESAICPSETSSNWTLPVQDLHVASFCLALVDQAIPRPSRGGEHLETGHRKLELKRFPNR